MAELHRDAKALREMEKVSDRAHMLAYHEAAHAVKARAFGWPIREVSVNLRNDSGHADVATSGGPAWSAVQAAAMLLAGRLGELLRFDEVTDNRGDDAALAELRGAVSFDSREAESIASSILAQNRRAVDALAGELIRRRTLHGDQVAAVLDAAGMQAGYWRAAVVTATTTAREAQPTTRTVIRTAGRTITDPAEVREWRVSLIRRGFEQRGEPWTEAAEQEARRRLGEVTRNGEIRGFAQSPIVR